VSRASGANFVDFADFWSARLSGFLTTKWRYLVTTTLPLHLPVTWRNRYDYHPVDRVWHCRQALIKDRFPTIVIVNNEWDNESADKKRTVLVIRGRAH
jgi:hypothetical protein